MCNIVQLFKKGNPIILNKMDAPKVNKLSTEMQILNALPYILKLNFKEKKKLKSKNQRRNIYVYHYF